MSRDATGTVATGTTALSVTIPAGATTGSLMVLHVGCSSGSGSVATGTTGNTGWTIEHTDTDAGGSPEPSISVLWKVCGSGDAGASVTVTFNNAPTTCLGQVVTYLGANTTTPFETSGVIAHGTSGTTHVSPSITTAKSTDWILATWVDRSGSSWTAPGGYTLNGNSASGAVASIGVTDSGGTVTAGTIQVTATGSVSTSTYTAWAGALQVPSAAAAPYGALRQPVRARLPQQPAGTGAFRGRARSSPGSVPPVAVSGSAKALQRSAADKLAYLYDGSLVYGYWDGHSGQVGHITNPLGLAPGGMSVTSLISTAEDGISIWADNTAGTSSDIWVCSSDDDASGAGPSLHVRHGTYTAGVFTWDASTLISGTTTADTITSTITWNGTYLMVFWWDGVSGSDRVSYAYTTTKNGTSGWSAAATLSESATWSTIVQVCARHSAKLAATIVVYGGNSQMHYACLADSAASPALANWGGRAEFDQFDDSLAVFGGPQVVIDENSGAIHVVRAVVNSGGPTWDGVTYWNGTYTAGSPGSVAFAARVIVASAASATGPADIAAAVDPTGTAWVLWTDNTTQGNLKYATLASPFTSASAATTLIAGGASSNPRWPHVPAVSPAQAGLTTALPVLYTDTTSSPYPVLLNTSIALPGITGPVFRQATQAIRARIPQVAPRGRVTSNPVVPALLLVNTAEGGTSGTSATTGNTGGGSGAAFDAVNIGAGATVAFDNTHYAHGSLSYKIATGASGVNADLDWISSLGRQVQVWFRYYLYFTANPVSNHRIAEFGTPAVAGVACGGLIVETNGKLAMVDAAGAPQITSTNTIPLNQWFRVEGFILGNHGYGQLQFKLFTAMDSTTPVETKTSAATLNTTGQIGNVRIGPGGYNVANVGPFWIDDIGLSNTGYLGPSGTPPPPPLQGPVQARIAPPFSKGRVSSSPGAPVRNPSSGPVFYQARQAIRPRLPQQPVLRGRVTSNPPAPVRNPAPGPVFAQKPAPVRYILPPWQPRAGRIGSSFGAPVLNPLRGPPVYAPQGPVRARLPQLQPRAGRVMSGPGTPAANPVTGPVFRQKTYPVQAADPLPRRGRTYASLTAPSVVFLTPAPFYPARQAIRAKLPQPPVPRGRVTSSAGAPVRDPSSGPLAYPAQGPVRARLPQLQPRAGRVYAGPGSPARNPAAGPPVPALQRPVRSPVPQAFSKGRTSSNAGSPVRNPSAGPVFFPAVRPARAPVPQAFSKGRAASGPGAPLANPSQGPAFRQATAPARIRPALPPRGRTSSNAGGPVQNPPPVVIGTPPYPLQGPVRARLPQLQPRAGRITSGPGSVPPLLLVNSFDGGTSSTTISAGNSGGVSGNAFNTVTVGSNATLTYSNTEYAHGSLSARFTTGASSVTDLLSWTAASVGIQPKVWFRLYAYFTANPAATIRLFRAQSNGAQCAGLTLTSSGNLQMVNAAGAAVITSSNTIPLNQWFRVEGFVTGSPGAGQVSLSLFFLDAQVPVETDTSAATLNTTGPVNLVQYGNTGAVANVSAFWLDSIGLSNTGYLGPASFTGPASQGYPSRARVTPGGPLPRGRVSSSPGAPVRNPVQGAAFPAPPGPVAARFPEPGRTGRVSSSAGVPAVNPGTGPAFRQAVHPAAARLPVPFLKGRASGSPGTPARNPSQGPALTPPHGPVQSRVPLPPRGRAAGVRAAAVPAAPHGPAVYPLHSPVRVPVPQAFSKGRVTANPGTPPAVPAPVYPLHGPVRIRPVLPPRGRTAGSPGVPVAAPAGPAPVYPLHGPVAARRPLPQRGRTAGNPGTQARNPSHGPPVYPQHGPAGLANRAPGPFRKGSAQVSARSPVGKSASPVALRFTPGLPGFQWAAGSVTTQWRVP